MEYETINVRIEREEIISLIFEEKISSIKLSESDVEDLETFYNDIFTFIINNGKMIMFNLIDEGTDLFHDVSVDIINQVTAEIKKSEPQFETIRELLEVS